MKKLSSMQAGSLGEMLALAKLNSIGLAAYISPEGAPGHDLMAIVGGEAKSFEVKTRQYLKRPTEITRWPIDMKAKGEADYFLFVELNIAVLAPTFYLLTSEQVRQMHKTYSGLGTCPPPEVRRVAVANDFTQLLGDMNGNPCD